MVKMLAMDRKTGHGDRIREFLKWAMQHGVELAQPHRHTMARCCKACGTVHDPSKPHDLGGTVMCMYEEGKPSYLNPDEINELIAKYEARNGAA